MSDLLLARAHALGGAFAWRDAAELGPRELHSLVRSGAVIDVGPRAYVLGQAHHAATTDEQQHRLVTMAVLRSFDGRVAGSHHSAAALHDLPFWQVDARTVHVARLTGKASGRRQGLVIHEAYPGFATITSPRSGLHSVHVALALIGTTLLNGEEAGVVAADAALHRNLTTRAELTTWLDRLRHRPGLVSARRAVELADGRAESVGESRTRLILLAMPDLPAVIPQYELRDEVDTVWARGDFLVGEHVIVEFDGRVKYRAADGATSKQVHEVVWAEKQREDRIRRERKLVVRVVWADLDRPRLLQSAVRAAVRDADRLLVPVE